jgi:hypothetical protein
VVSTDCPGQLAQKAPRIRGNDPCPSFPVRHNTLPSQTPGELSSHSQQVSSGLESAEASPEAGGQRPGLETEDPTLESQ